MKINPKPSRKKILSDPVALFATLHTKATEQQISELKKLWLTYSGQKKQHRGVQSQGKKISRQIGEQKRAGGSIEQLKADMQKHGKNLADIARQLAETETRILEYFDSAENDNVSDKQHTPVSENRTYPASATRSEEVQIALLGNEQQAWDDYVAGNPATSIYHRSVWKDVIQKTFGHQGLYFFARDRNGNVVGILPLIRLKSILFGDFMVSMPYFNYGGAVADHPSIEQELMLAASKHAASLGISHIEYRDGHVREGLPARSDKVNMILQLPGSTDELWQGFTPKLRAQIRRPQREKPQVHYGGTEYLDDFYAVFSRNMRDLGTPVYGKSFFRNILHRFPEASRIIVITHRNRPVAAGFLLGYRDKLEIPWASTIRDVNHLSMNMLLYWEVLKVAIEQQYKQFDFGRSSSGSGTFRFKQQWGAKPHQLYWHYWLKENGKLPELNPDNPKFTLAINVWRRLPLTLTRWLGPSIVRSLP